MNPYLTALISVLGVVIGASLQFWFSRTTTNWSRLQDRRVQAYVDFLKAVSGIAQAQRFKDKKTELEFAALVADARARIAVYGHSEVVASLAEFDKTDVTFQSSTARKAFIQLIRTMRKESNADIVSIGEDELYSVLFGYRSGGEFPDKPIKYRSNHT